MPRCRWDRGSAVWLVPDPHDLAIRLWVNDQLRQDASTGT